MTSGQDLLSRLVHESAAETERRRAVVPEVSVTVLLVAVPTGLVKIAWY